MLEPAPFLLLSGVHLTMLDAALLFSLRAADGLPARKRREYNPIPEVRRALFSWASAAAWLDRFEGFRTIAAFPRTLRRLHEAGLVRLSPGRKLHFWSPLTERGGWIGCQLAALTAEHTVSAPLMIEAERITRLCRRGLMQRQAVTIELAKIKAQRLGSHEAASVGRGSVVSNAV